jgi:CRISPR-associated exonuclease Cas4
MTVASFRSTRIDEYPEDQWLELSGVQHFAFCHRQWALIHIEGVWQDNLRTTEGDIEHERAHDHSASDKRRDVLTVRDLRVHSARIGVVGDCDVVEFHRSQTGVALAGRDGLWQAYPVEYKHGSTKHFTDADRVQLCGEAICLEDMLGCSIPEGALFYQKTKHREIVTLDSDLRREFMDLLGQMRYMYERGITPKPKLIPGCASCSLKDLCLPELTRRQTVRTYIARRLKADDVGISGKQKRRS